MISAIVVDRAFTGNFDGSTISYAAFTYYVVLTNGTSILHCNSSMLTIHKGNQAIPISSLHLDEKSGLIHFKQPTTLETLSASLMCGECRP